MTNGCGGCEVRKDGIVVRVAAIINELTAFITSDGLKFSTRRVNDSYATDSPREKIGAEVGGVDAIW